MGRRRNGDEKRRREGSMGKGRVVGEGIDGMENEEEGLGNGRKWGGGVETGCYSNFVILGSNIEKIAFLIPKMIFLAKVINYKVVPHKILS
jgi:hypothetical protein